MEFKGSKGDWKITQDNITEDGSGYIAIGTDKDWWQRLFLIIFHAE